MLTFSSPKQNNPSDTVSVTSSSVSVINLNNLNRIGVRQFQLKNIDNMRKDILRWDEDESPFIIDGNASAPYDWFRNQTPIPNDYTPKHVMYNQNQLALKTYQSDLFNNWISPDGS